LKKLFICFFLLLCIKLRCQPVAIPALIPIPESVETHTGHFVFSPNTKIVCSYENQMSDVNWFNDYLEKYYGYKLGVLSKAPEKENYILLYYPDFEGGWKENYHLDISSNKIQILAEGNGAGFFYAFQTLAQLIPVQEMRSPKAAPANTFQLPCLSIKDKPKFSWRGMHLDVCRHFFPVSFIKRYLDLMAQYKFNTFHWHLTEDQGWRIEIKKYPLLTGKGAWRNGTMIGKYSNKKYDTIRYGGYYSQEEIKDIVSYASKLHITVVPEIEMPGHSQAAVAAYPWLSCRGQQLEVAKGWGVFEDVYCSKDSVLHFIQDVLDEVLQLFPGKYIHIGGDECPKTRWKECPNCQARIKNENLKDEHELQSWFITRIEKYLNSKGRNIIGWDEILEGGLAPNAAVMSWRGTEGGIAAAKLKHEVVMSPGKPCYFDHYQAKDKTKEPLAIGGFNPVDSVYRYEPVPKALKEDEQKYILGAQGNVWTEYILNEKQVEYMAVPRMCALAEVLWSPKEKRNLNDFRKRLKENSKKLDRQNVNYAKHFLK
jgi:hexosaminidase